MSAGDKMDSAQEELFGKFPRPVGQPHQFFVHSEKEFDSFLEVNQGKHNIYSCISHFESNGTPVSDKVSLDLDSPAKESAFSDMIGEKRKIEKMRSDDGLANDVLGEVVSDAKEVAKWARETEVPLIGVYTGFGIHLHCLYQPENRAKDKLTSTAVMLRKKLELQSVDRVIIGDVDRIMRVPNCERVDDGRGCNLYTIPLTRDELLSWSPTDYLESSNQPRRIDVPEFERPEMEHYPDYTNRQKGGNRKTEDVEKKQVDSHDEQTDETFRNFIRDVLKMPCMANRVLQPDPEHPIRQNFAVMMFNLGLDVSEVHSIIRRLNWTDYDSKITQTMLEQIYRKGYRDRSCSSLMSDGYCVYEPGERDECPTRGWKGGEVRY